MAQRQITGVQIDQTTLDADNFLPTQSGNAGYYLTTDGTNVSWAPLSGGGTVTSVDLASPNSTISVTGGPVTTSGTIDVDLPVQGGVTPSSYTNADITVDAYGRITAVASGAPTPPAGSTGEIQFNNGGSFGADADFVWNQTDNALEITGDQKFVGTARKIRGDFTNSTIANRTLFQTSTTNGTTTIGTIPNGTGTFSGFRAFTYVDPDNSPYLQVLSSTAATIIDSNKTGTGTAQSLQIRTSGTARLTITSAGASTFSGSLTASSTLAVTGTSALTGALTVGSGSTKGQITARGNGTTEGGYLQLNNFDNSATAITFDGGGTWGSAFSMTSPAGTVLSTETGDGSTTSAVLYMNNNSLNQTININGTGSITAGGTGNRGQINSNGDGTTDGGLVSVFNYDNSFSVISYNGGSSTGGPNFTMFDFANNLAVQFGTGNGTSGASNTVEVYSTDTSVFSSAAVRIDGGSDTGGSSITMKGLADNGNLNIVTDNTGTGNSQVLFETATGTANEVDLKLKTTAGAAVLVESTQVVMPVWTLATLPTGIVGGTIYVSDATGASVTGSLCFFNGTNWIDVTTGVTVV